MKITDKELSKLKQLDRIEFLLKLDNRKKRFEGSYSLTFVKYSALLFGFLILFFVGMANFNLQASLSILGLMEILFKVTQTLFICFLIADLIRYALYRSLRKDLIDQYFDFKIEVKKK